MELTYYFRLAQRWLWLWVLTTLIAGGTTYWISNQEPAIYQATAKLLIGPDVVSSLDPQLNDLRTGAELMHTYAEIIETEPFLETVSSNLSAEAGIDITTRALARIIKRKSNDETRILTINAEDTRRFRVVPVANAVAEALVRSSPSGPIESDAMLREQMRAEIEKLQASIAASEARLAQLETRLKSTPSAEAQRAILGDISSERNRLTDDRRTLVLLYEALRDTFTNQVKILEPAVTSRRLDTDTPLKTMLGGLAGLIVGLVFTVVADYLLDTFQAAEDVAQVTGAPILATFLGRQEVGLGFNQGQLLVQVHPETPAAETYRLLSARLLLSSQPAPPLRSVLFTSLQADDNAGEVASNVAMTLAQTGRRVTLVDANLRHPTIHCLFGIDDQGGLINALRASSHLPQPATVKWAPGLSLLHGKPDTSSPFETLASAQMIGLIERLKQETDILLIVAAPIQAFADSLLLASQVDGVIFVASVGVTSRNHASRAVQNLRMLGTQAIGTVLIDRRRLLWRIWYKFGKVMLAVLPGRLTPALRANGKGEERLITPPEATVASPTEIALVASRETAIMPPQEVSLITPQVEPATVALEETLAAAPEATSVTPLEEAAMPSMEVIVAPEVEPTAVTLEAALATAPEATPITPLEEAAVPSIEVVVAPEVEPVATAPEATPVTPLEEAAVPSIEVMVAPEAEPAAVAPETIPVTPLEEAAVPSIEVMVAPVVEPTAVTLEAALATAPETTPVTPLEEAAVPSMEVVVAPVVEPTAVTLEAALATAPEAIPVAPFEEVPPMEVMVAPEAEPAAVAPEATSVTPLEEAAVPSMEVMAAPEVEPAATAPEETLATAPEATPITPLEEAAMPSMEVMVAPEVEPTATAPEEALATAPEATPITPLEEAAVPSMEVMVAPEVEPVATMPTAIVVVPEEAAGAPQETILVAQSEDLATSQEASLTALLEETVVAPQAVTVMALPDETAIVSKEAAVAALSEYSASAPREANLAASADESAADLPEPEEIVVVTQEARLDARSEAPMVAPQAATQVALPEETAVAPRKKAPPVAPPKDHAVAPRKTKAAPKTRRRRRARTRSGKSASSRK